MVGAHRLPIRNRGRGKIGYCNTNFKPISKILSYLYATDRATMSEKRLVPKPFVMWRLMQGVVTREWGGSAQEIVEGQKTFNLKLEFPGLRKAPIQFRVSSPLASSSAFLQAID
jgi:hypothetical protein